MDPNKIYGFFFKGDFDNYYLGHQFEEIFKARIYSPYLEKNPKLKVVLDIGGNLGLFSLYASKYAESVFCVEPSAEHFDNITRMITFNELSNVRPLKKAIFTEDITLPLFGNKNKTMYSLHSAVADQSIQPELVEAVTLATLFKANNIEHVDLMKLDVEGTESEILSSQSFKEVADKIDTIVLEVHNWNGRHPNQVKEALKNNGFTVESIPNDANILVARRSK